MNRRDLTSIAILGSILLLPIAYAFSGNKTSNLQNNVLVASQLSPAQIRELAQAVTVKVLTTKNGGSGILIAKGRQTYTVLTNAHVIAASGAYRIQTPDGLIHQAVVKNKGNSQTGNDLAVLEFQSPQNYRVVDLATAPDRAENQPIYAAGFPFDSQELVVTSGKISLGSPKPLVGGYQLGYTNEIKQGMSGGPLLDRSGKLVGVNGLLAYPILNNAYVYQDGSRPSNELRQRLRKLSFAVPIQTLAQVAPQLAVIQPEWSNTKPVHNQPTLTGLAGEIDLVAQKITLRIDSKNNGNGSGIVIAHQGQTYYVLTAYHVVKNPDAYTIVTPDGQKHSVKANDVVKENGLDVAILKFTSNKTYPLATLAKYNLSDLKRHWVFLSGFPKSSAGKRKINPGFRFSREEGFLQTKDTASNLSNGYELVYTNLSLKGMSGGPLIDTKGRVIGIGGRQEGEIYSEKIDRNLGYALGVPISIGLGLASKAGIKREWMNLETDRPPTLTEAQVSQLRQQPEFNAAKPPEDADENHWLNYGNQLWRLERFDEALEALQQAIKLNPDFYQARYALGLVLQSQEKYQEAVATFKQVTQLRPDYYQAWRELSASLYFLKKYPEALAAIDQAIQLNFEQADVDNPKDFLLYIYRVNILSDLKRYTEAEAACTEAIKIMPSSVAAYYNRGLLRAQLKNYQAAEADYNKAISLNPEYALAYTNRGVIRLELKNYQAAEADYTKAISLNPEDANAYYNRGLLRKKLKNYQAAEADYTKAISLNPDDAAAYNSRGNLRKKLKNYQAAEADYTKAISLNPDDALAYNNRGNLRLELKNYQAAEADYTKAILLNPEDALAYYNRGNLRLELKNYQAAEADYTKAILLNSEYASAYYNRGNLHAELKNYQAAEADYTKAISLNPEYANAYGNRGILRAELKNYQAAEADLQIAAQLFHKQGNMDAYQQVQQLLSQLQALSR